MFQNKLSIKQFRDAKLNCPKCNTDKLHIRYNTGISRNKVPYFYGSVKCSNCKYFVKASNPQKLIRIFTQK